MKIHPAILLTIMLASGQTLAQGSESVDWKIAPYLWTVGIDGSATLAGYDQDLDRL
jgi:hypothetical protein